MSKIYDVQESLKTGLISAVTELTTSNVVVDRQQDVDSQIGHAVDRSTGLACLIGVVEGETIEQETIPGPRMLVTIRLLFLFKPIISDNSTGTTADETIEDVLQYVHHLTLTPRASMCHEFEVVNFSILPDPEFLTYVIDVETIVQH